MGEHPKLSTGTPADGGEQQGTTTFSSVTVAEPYDRQSSIIDPQNDFDVETDDIKSIADFLAKPVSVATGTFSGANTWGASLFSSSILTLLNAQSIWLNKIQGFLNIRGDVKFRLVVNPTPFQQGLLRLTYFPCANQMTQSYNSHMFNRVTISQLPGTYLNMNDNFCEITVPYLSPTTFLERDLVAGATHVDWGNVDITVMEIFRTGTGPSSVNWNLWMSIENLELSAMVEPQMVPFEPQMARKRPKRRLGTIDEETNSGKGPIAKIMSSGATLANQLSSIPVLTPLAKPAGWVLSALSSAAEALGWSKPTLSEGPCPMARNIHWYMNNSDGNDSCMPLSLRTDNRVSAITDASPGELDEMSFNFIKSRWSYLSDFQWTAARVTGDLLYSFQVAPAGMKQSTVVNGQSVSVIPAAAAFQEFYANWRGSFQYRVRLVKTGFHTGTIAVTWTPGKIAGVPSYADTSYMYRQIIDLQTGSDFIFDLPYLLPQDFNHVSEDSGIITIHCVNPLLAPATCSSTIDVFVEIRGGDDLIYVNPRNTFDAIPYVPQMVYEPQGVETENSGEATAISMSSRPHTLSSVHHAMIANGEIQLSVLDLLKTQCIIRYASGFSPSANSGAPVLVAAGQIYAQRWNGVANVNSQIGGDIISFIGSFFAFHRGAERFRLSNTDAANPNVNYRAMLVNDSDTGLNNIDVVTQAVGNATNWSSILSATDGGTTPQTGRYIAIPRDNGGVAVQAPFYSRFRYLLNTWTTATGVKTNRYSNQVAVGVTARNSSGVTLSKSVGDDFQFSFFLGIPVYASAQANDGPFLNIS